MDDKITPNLLFVYGTLRSGAHNHPYLKGAKFVGLAQTNGMLLFDYYSELPIVVTNTLNYPRGRYSGVPPTKVRVTTDVTGEVYEVPEDRWADLDRLEGHPVFYCRTLRSVNLFGKRGQKLKKAVKAWIYVIPAEKAAGKSYIWPNKEDYFEALQVVRVQPTECRDDYRTRRSSMIKTL